MPQLVSVYQTLDTLSADLAASLLEQEGIRCMVRKHETQNLLGMGTLGGYNPLFGPLEVLVNDSDAEQAGLLLKTMETLYDVPEAESPALDEAQNASAFSSFRQLKKPLAVLYLLQLPIVMIASYVGRVGLAIALLVLSSVIYFSFELRDHLRRIGYEWVSLYDAVWILFSLRSRAFKIPPASDFELLPGFERTSVCLVDLVRELKAHSKQRPNA